MFYKCDQVKEDLIAGACVTHGGRDKWI